MQFLQHRQKWNTRRASFLIDNVLLLKTMDISRKERTMVSTKSDSNGLVRTVYLKIGDKNRKKKARSVLELPVNKIVLLIKIDLFDL